MPQKGQIQKIGIKKIKLNQLLKINLKIKINKNKKPAM
jgi:hypothetical protein